METDSIRRLVQKITGRHKRVESLRADPPAPRPEPRAGEHEDDERPADAITHLPGHVNFHRRWFGQTRKVDPVTRRVKRTRTDRVRRRDFYNAFGELVADDDTPFGGAP